MRKQNKTIKGVHQNIHEDAIPFSIFIAGILVGHTLSIQANEQRKSEREHNRRMARDTIQLQASSGRGSEGTSTRSDVNVQSAIGVFDTGGYGDVESAGQYDGEDEDDANPDPENDRNERSGSDRGEGGLGRGYNYNDIGG